MERLLSPYAHLKKWVDAASCTVEEKRGAVVSSRNPDTFQQSVHIHWIDDGGIIFTPHLNTIPGHPCGDCSLFFWHRSGRQVLIKGDVTPLPAGSAPVNTQYSTQSKFLSLVKYNGLRKAIKFFIRGRKVVERKYWTNSFVLTAESFEFVKPSLLVNQYKRYYLENNTWKWD